MLANNCKKYVFLIIFMFAITANAQESFYLLADKIIKNDKEKLILAQGNVEIQNGRIKTRSDSLQFDTQRNQITLEGNIRIINEQGDIVFAEKAILDKEMKEGIIKKLGVLMSDESRLVASSAQKDRKKYKTIYKNIAYSRCKNCENRKGTFWKLNAKKATHLEKSKVILYEDVFLEVLNLPLLYFPFFYHPDPTVKRKTGLLAPSFSQSNVFGASYEQPLFLNLSPKSDLTLKTKLTQKEGVLLKKNSRSKRDFLMRALLKNKIDTRPFFLSMNKQKVFKKMKIFSKSKMPNSEYLSNNGFYLPSGLGISDSEIRYVCTTLNQLLR